MEVSKTKTARFNSVVEACGAPEAASLWTKPEQDPDFMKAVRQERVMTVKPGTDGGKTDTASLALCRTNAPLTSCFQTH